MKLWQQYIVGFISSGSSGRKKIEKMGRKYIDLFCIQICWLTFQIVVWIVCSRLITKSHTICWRICTMECHEWIFLFALCIGCVVQHPIRLSRFVRCSNRLGVGLSLNQLIWPWITFGWLFEYFSRLCFYAKYCKLNLAYYEYGVHRIGQSFCGQCSARSYESASSSTFRRKWQIYREMWSENCVKFFLVA